jgi:hypothetical protein
MAKGTEVVNEVRRPRLATATAVLHFAMALACIAIAVYLLILTRSPEILNDKDAADAVHGLKIGAAVVGPVAIPYILIGIGVWKGRIWGWIVGLILNVLAVAVFIEDSVSERRIDWDDMSVAAIFVVLLVPLLLPPVWRWCWRRRAATVAPGAND